MSSTELAIPELEHSLASYAVLRTRVREALRQGHKRAEEAVERERVRTAWEVGKLIQEHILLNKARANYGEQVIKRLSADFSISATELHYMVEFARAYPIFRSTGKLPWGHHQALLRINNERQRRELQERAERENWTQKELRREITKLKGKGPQAVKAALKEPLHQAQKGIPYTYKIVKLEGRLQIDLGFSCYLDLPEKSRAKFKEGNIIQAKAASLSAAKMAPARHLAGGDPSAIASSEGAPAPAHRMWVGPGKQSLGLGAGSAISILKKGTQADFFTYRARLLAITDADTLWTFIDLGFGITTVQQLRLRGIDAPEISSRDGQAAKRFVERELKYLSFPHVLSGSPRTRSPILRQAQDGERSRTIKAFGDDKSLLITSTKSDKYDRYLADVYYPNKKGEQFLNNRLLEERLAMRV